MAIHFSLLFFLTFFAIKAVKLVEATPSVILDSSETAPKVHTRFTSAINPEVSLRFVADSGVCETTAGVHQISGYVDVGKNMSMWFWFFESRISPETAPFTLWVDGGPGCSSMIGLFQQHGPCSVNKDGNTVINPYSWNSISNVIYVDQPIGAGLSRGDETVNSTQSAAPFVWQAFQILFESDKFSKFKSREFIFATEGYGGHYGTGFVTFFNEQNTKIDGGQITGEKITVSALMINNGWFDPIIQYKSFVDFATNAPGYGQLQNQTVLKLLNQNYYNMGGCKDQEGACYAAGNSTGSGKICRTSDDFCANYIYLPSIGDRDANDLRQNSSAPFPPKYYVDFLHQASIKKQIGAEAEYKECSDSVYNHFRNTGDYGRSWLPQLGALANSKLKILIWAGDADIDCNWLGVHASVLAMDWYGKKALNMTPFTNMTINGKPVAAIQNVDKFSFARVYLAGQAVPAYQPRAAFEIFKQIVHLEPLHSVSGYD